LSIGTVAMAQSSSLRTRISDDERTLSIRIDGNQNGRKIHFNQAFDVSKMSNLRKEMIKYRVYTSQGLIIPIHEMPWTVFTVLGTLVLVITLFVIRFQPKNPARIALK
jgi:hypothetical protein